MTPYAGPELLRADHDLDGFGCGDDALDQWLATKALHNQAEGGSRTWVVTQAQRVVAYYASSTAVVLRAEATKRAARTQPEPIPALLLGRLAVDQKHQGQGLGAALLKHFLLKSLEVADITGVRLLLVHAKDDAAAAFYRRYDFQPSPINDLTLMLLTKDLRPGLLRSKTTRRPRSRRPTRAGSRRGDERCPGSSSPLRMVTRDHPEARQHA